jgi:hypothetical protein
LQTAQGHASWAGFFKGQRVPDEEAATERTIDMQAYIKRVFNTLTLGR